MSVYVSGILIQTKTRPTEYVLDAERSFHVALQYAVSCTVPLVGLDMIFMYVSTPRKLIPARGVEDQTCLTRTWGFGALKNLRNTGVGQCATASHASVRCSTMVAHHRACCSERQYLLKSTPYLVEIWHRFMGNVGPMVHFVHSESPTHASGNLNRHVAAVDQGRGVGKMLDVWHRCCLCCIIGQKRLLFLHFKSIGAVRGTREGPLGSRKAM